MNTLAFDEAGRCVGVINDYIDLKDFPGAKYVKHTSIAHMAESVRLDVATQQLVFKAPMPAKVSPNKVEGLPVGTLALINGVEVEVNDGVLDLEVMYPETVWVYLRHSHYLDGHVEVPCEAQG